MTNKQIFHIIFFSALITAGISSCKNEESTNEYTWYLASDRAVSLNKEYINMFLTNASTYYESAGSLKAFIKDDVNVYKLTYLTEVKGEEIEATGLVCFPGSPGEYPVLCFQNGTNTVNSYAPSNFVINTSYQFIELVASFGFAVVIPDYPGFGGSSDIPHPYLVKEPTVRSIADMLRAVKEASPDIQEGIMIKNEYYLAGYSQGGWATMALHKALEKDYSDEFALKGSACGAGPYDMMYLFRNMINAETYPMPSYIAYIINAYSEYGQFTNSVSDILNPPYDTKLSTLFNGTLDLDDINSQLTNTISQLLTAGFISGFESDSKYMSIRESMEENSIQPYKTNIPLYLFHGGADTQVSPLVTDYFYDGMIAAGTSSGLITRVILPGLDHGDASVPGLIDGFIFLTSLTKK